MPKRVILDPRTQVGLYLPAMISFWLIFALGMATRLGEPMDDEALVEMGLALLTGSVVAGLVIAVQVLRRQSLQNGSVPAGKAVPEQRHDLVGRGLAIGVWDWDPQTGAISLSAEAEAVFGAGTQASIRTFDDVLERVHPGDVEKLRSALSDHQQKQSPLSLDVRVIQRDGQTVWCHLTGQAQWRGGRAIRIAGSIEDITAERERERARRQGEMRLRAVTQSTVDAVITTDAAGTILDANPACLDVFGHDPEMLVGDNVRRLVPTAHASQHDSYIRQFLNSGTSDIVGKVREVMGQHADGSAIPVELAVTEYREDGQHLFVATARDLSARQQASTEREAFIARLEESHGELERFNFAASHDLREPLRMIVNFSQMLQQRYSDQLDSDGRKALNVCMTSAQHMQTLLDALVSFANTRDDLSQIETFKPAEMIERAQQRLADEIERTRASITLHELPPSLRANPARFSRVFRKLFANALKFSGDAAPQIEVSASPFEAGWLFTVSDTGIGMRPDYCEQIFEPFKKLHPTSEYPGTGMGLAICRRIVTSAGGRIWAVSRPGEGSHFHVYWPELPVGARHASGDAGNTENQEEKA